MHKIHCERNTIKCPKCACKLNRSDLEKHNSDLHAPKKCENCSQEMEIRFFSEHICPKKPTLCTYCEASFPADQFKSHTSQCGNRTDQCPRCKEFIRKKDFQEHSLQNSCVPPRPKPPVRNVEEYKVDAGYPRNPQIEEERKAPQVAPRREPPLVSSAEKKNMIPVKEERPRMPSYNSAIKNQAQRKEKEGYVAASVMKRGSAPALKQGAGMGVNPRNNERKIEEIKKKPIGPSRVKNYPIKPGGDDGRFGDFANEIIDDIPYIDRDQMPVNKPVAYKPPTVSRNEKNLVSPPIQSKNSPAKRPGSKSSAEKKPDFYENYYEDYTDDIPAEVIQESLRDQYPVDIGEREEVYTEERVAPTISQNLLDDEEQILRSVIEESKKDNFGLSQEDQLMNEIVMKSLKEK